jgi:glycine/D-amino acid oxidase-like deaminating enzyme
MQDNKYDVAIVGAGIVGLAIAYAAAKGIKWPFSSGTREQSGHPYATSDWFGRSDNLRGNCLTAL